MKKALLILLLGLLVYEANSQISYVARQYDNGLMQYTGSLDGIEETGEWKFFHPNGKLAAVGEFAKGDKTGMWKFYYNNGKLESTGAFTNNKKVGVWKYYQRNGELRPPGYTSASDKENIGLPDSEPVTPVVGPNQFKRPTVDTEMAGLPLDNDSKVDIDPEGDNALLNQLKAKEKELENEAAYADYLKKELEERLYKVQELEAIISMNNEAANKMVISKDNALAEAKIKEAALAEAARKEAA
ncbi:MAG: hypothetical protein AAF466_07730, partial [Bacteroidota bacterium]